MPWSLCYLAPISDAASVLVKLHGWTQQCDGRGVRQACVVHVDRHYCRRLACKLCGCMREARRSLLLQVVLNSFYVTLWISLSGTVILYNKWILAYYGFPYPISLTMWHMAFSSVLAFLCVRLGYVPAVNMTTDTYVKAILPIGALFAGVALYAQAVHVHLNAMSLVLARLPAFACKSCPKCTCIFANYTSMSSDRYAILLFGALVAGDAVTRRGARRNVAAGECCIPVPVSVLASERMG